MTRLNKQVKEVKNRDLFALEKEVRALNRGALGMLLAGKIKEFYKLNGDRVDTLKMKINEMLVRFFEVENPDTWQQDGKVNLKYKPADPKEKPILEFWKPRMPADKKEMTPILKPFMTQERYEEEFHQLMDQENRITLI